MAPSAVPVNGDFHEPPVLTIALQLETPPNGPRNGELNESSAINGAASSHPGVNRNTTPYIPAADSDSSASSHPSVNRNTIPYIPVANGDSSAQNSEKPVPIAIVGMGCRLPGEVSTPADFWKLCSRARSGWSEIPKSRFNHAAFHHPNPDKLGCYNPQGGHFLEEDIGLFDAPFFNITEKEAISMDPQQRLLLECTFEALENAGIPKQSLAGKDVAVYVGGSFADYELNNVRDTDTTPMHQATGCAPSILSGRLSYYFDFKGPSAVVDTACSSSLVALHLACQSLNSGESSHAIVASCHLNILPDHFITMSTSSLFSDDGKSFAFDSRADGFGRGEGVGCVVLKPLDEAIKANDAIRAVIVGSGVNQDGKTKGITMPDGNAQVSLMNSVYERSGLDVKETGYVECHGTGTRAGDPIEAAAVHKVFGQGTTPRKPLYIGSVKSNIGHLEGASGIVSVIKAAMMLEKGFILPNCDFQKPNPNIPLKEWNLKVPINQRPWPQGKKYASINNFGFGGTNAHAILARAPLMPKPNVTTAQGVRKRLFVLSANDRKSLESQMHAITVYLEQNPAVFQNSLMGNLAYTLGQRRSILSWKVAIPANGSADLITSLAGSTTTLSRSSKRLRIGFVFTGQGAQWAGMGRELIDSYPVFASTMEKIDACLSKLGAGFSLISELSKDIKSSRLSEAQISQPVCTAIQLSLTELLKSWGVLPVAVVGHSSGEIAAAYATGALSLEACVAIAYQRGQAIVSLKSQFPDLKGAMVAIGGSAEEIRRMAKLLKEGRVTIACINSPSSITASGDEEAIAELQEKVEQKEMFNRKLRVDTAYHSHHMNLVAHQYSASIKTVTSQATSGVVFNSSLRGCQIGTEELGPAYWVDNLTCPVRFSDAVECMIKPVDGSSSPAVDILVEVGPHAALEGPIKQILKTVEGNAVKIPYASALLRGKNAVDTSLQLAATLFVKGADLNFEGINFPILRVNPPTLLTDLPRYNWNHSTKYWHDSRIGERHRNREFPRNDIVGVLASYSNDLEPTWRNMIRADDQPWVRHHKMQSMIVYPMAGYIAMAIEAAAQRAVMRNLIFDKFNLREVTVSRPLVIHEGADVETNIQLRAFTEGTRMSSDSWDEFRIFSWAKDRGWIEHARGLISVAKHESNVVDGARQLADSKNALSSQMAKINEACQFHVKPSEMYKTLTLIGAEYGTTFQGLENCRASDEYAVADLVIPNTAATMPKGYEPNLIIHPALLDQVIQILWPILGAGRTDLDILYMPSFVQNMSIVTGITTKAGDRLHVYGSGKPTPSKPAATKFSFFVTSPDGGDEQLISIESLVMMPVFEGSNSLASVAGRELCYKLQWDPAFATLANGSESHTESAAVANGHASFPPEFEVAIICDPERQQSLAMSLTKLLTSSMQRPPVVGKLGEISTESRVCIVLDELVRQVVSDLNPSSFKAIQEMTSTATGILWAVRGAYSDSENPHAQMTIGMARSIRSETLLKFTTLDLGVSPQLSELDTADKIFDVFKNTFSTNTPTVGFDLEYQERNGQLFVPRLVNDVKMNKFVHNETHPSAAPDLQLFSQEGRALKIAIETPGALDTLYFTDDLAVGTELPDYEVEIEIKATSMNFKDIMISMGQLSSNYIGVECSGVISATGSKVTDLQVGDRVCAMSEGAYSTHTRCLGTSVQIIGDGMSFEDAATIPVIYCTAYYSLFDLGRLTKGETVLIHAAAGGVGQAAIILCQMAGAEIFATVGSVAKKEFLISQYGLTEDHIFYSRNTSFAKGIRRATNGQGIDLVLNSLAGDSLRETWDSLAHFGRFIEIGKRDIVGNSRLEMSRFEHNAMYASVDMTVVAAERPKIMKRLLTDVFDLMSQGLIKPISPITIFPMSDIETAFRTLQSGKIMGKIVIVPHPGDQVKAVPAKTKELLQPDFTYVIIGGTGGLGRGIARWMIQKGARHIVLVSRSGKATGIVADLIEEGKSVQAQIEVRTCDVSSKEQVEDLVKSGISGMPTVRGVVHAAMVLDDVLFENMRFEQWEAVVKSKVAGAWNFHHALSNSPLDFFIAISSAAGAVGNRGQAAYSAANCFLNAFVQYRIKNGLPASSIDLTAVSDAGYLAENAEKQAQVAENLGSETVSESEVLALLAASISGQMAVDCNSHCITGLKIGPGLEELFWVNDAKFKYLKDAAEAEQAHCSTSVTSVSLSSALRSSGSYDEALQLVSEGLMDKISTVLMVQRDEMDQSRPIVVYGLDSLVAIEIRNWITRELEANLQVLELLTSSSIVALARTILEKSRLGEFTPAKELMSQA